MKDIVQSISVVFLSIICKVVSKLPVLIIELSMRLTCGISTRLDLDFESPWKLFIW